MKSYIRALTYYLPEKVLSNEDLSARFPDLKIADLTRLTGVFKRHIAAEDETAFDLALASARKLFSENNISPEEIDFILYNTQWSDYITPATACILQDRLGIPQDSGAIDISQGCTGYIYGLSLARGLVESNSAKNVLLLTSDTMSKSLHPEDKSNQAIFGDGAAATLISKNEVENGPFIGDFVFGTDGSGFTEIIIRHGGARYPHFKFEGRDYKDNFGNVRNDDYFFMNGAAVFSFSTKIAGELLHKIYEKTGYKQEDIDFFVFHQANRIILESVFRKNHIPPEKTIIHLEDCGNTVSSSIPIALWHAMEEKKVKKGDLVLLAGFGVGFSWAGTIVRL